MGSAGVREEPFEEGGVGICPCPGVVAVLAGGAELRAAVCARKQALFKGKKACLSLMCCYLCVSHGEFF